MRERNNILAESMLGWTREEVDNNTEEQRVQHEFHLGYCDGITTMRFDFFNGLHDSMRPRYNIKKHSL